MATQRITATALGRLRLQRHHHHHQNLVPLAQWLSTSSPAFNRATEPNQQTPRPSSSSKPLGQQSTRGKSTTGEVETITPYNEQASDDTGYVVTRKGYKKRVDKLDLSFLNHKDAFKSKSTWEVLRGLLVFQLCSIGPIVEHNEKLMKFGQAVLGKTLFAAIMKQTFYGQFVAGEDQERIKPTIHRMQTFGVKSILDYSVEEDISGEEAQKKELQGAVGDKETLEEIDSLKTKGTHEDKIRRYRPVKGEVKLTRNYKASSRTYFYENEASCEKNMQTFLRCIEAVADSTHGTGFSAIKMTALGRPSLLLQLSEVIVRARRYYQEVSGKDGFVIEGEVSKDAFQKRFKEKASYDNIDANEEVKDWLGNLTYDQKGLINLFSWSGLIDSKHLLKDVFKVPNLTTGKMEPLISALTDEEEEQFKNMLDRVHTVFQAAKDMNVRVMVDAEQTYFQPAIHRIAMEMMKKYNTEKAIVFNTYQNYLKIANHSLVLDLEQAKRQNFFFGAKLVRGAYMEQVRGRL